MTENQLPTPCPTCPLMANIAKLVPDKQEQINRYLLVQLDVLREQLRAKGVKRIPFTDDQKRRLVRASEQIINLLHTIKSLAKPDTLLKWNRAMKKKKWTFVNKKKDKAKKGIAQDTQALVVKFATENPAWGHRRIQGELKKLGHKICPTSVLNIMNEAGIPTAPNRKSSSWKQFLASHKDVIWACDNFTEEVWTRTGLLTCYVLVFIHHATRQVYVAGVTPNPTYEWVAQQGRNFSMMLEDNPQLPKIRYLIHDRDPALLALDHVLKPDGVKGVLTPQHAPMCNAFIERFIREARETLDNMIIIGQKHLLLVCKKIERHHNQHRPHQGIENKIPCGSLALVAPAPIEKIQCEETLGGLLNHYYAKAA